MVIILSEEMKCGVEYSYKQETMCQITISKMAPFALIFLTAWLTDYQGKSSLKLA